MGALRPEFPLNPKIAFEARLGVRRDDWDEQGAIPDLPPNFLVPCIAPDQLALVEPDFNPGASERLGESLRHHGVLVGVAEKNGFAGGL